MQMRQKDRIHFVETNAHLRKSLQCAASSVEDECLTPGLYENAWAKTIHTRWRSTGSEERNLYVLSGRWGTCGPCGQHDSEKPENQRSFHQCLPMRFATSSKRYNAPALLQANT